MILALIAASICHLLNPGARPRQTLAISRIFINLHTSIVTVTLSPGVVGVVVDTLFAPTGECGPEVGVNGCWPWACDAATAEAGGAWGPAVAIFEG